MPECASPPSAHCLVARMASGAHVTTLSANARAIAITSPASTPLAKPDYTLLYTGEERGYCDYPPSG